MTPSGSIMTLAMLAIFVGLVGIASTYPADARFMPFVVGIPAIGLCLLQLVLDARRRRRRSDAPAAPDVAPAAASPFPGAEEPPTPPALRRELTIWASFLCLIAGILLVGFWVSIPLFLVSFLRFQAKASWPLSLALGIGATLVLFLALEWMFRMELHRGFVVEYVRERMGA